jgi:hypothetical protein
MLRVSSPSRRPPLVGQAARVRFFGGESHAATVVEVGADGRAATVETEAGELMTFVLSAATARFVLDGDAHGPALELLA